ncbi:hypothetical protein PVAND_016484 [Polypedilum vanderplanki]|uniref:Uncharacterized protein n=1 Tax=Polypedilum vanderplanki TaxID=319348 RepID=A0A9J6BFQ8_POLVA|nr:hypothetical protein PVAND_016484 [Polypedilum vanderplanki]
MKVVLILLFLQIISIQIFAKFHVRITKINCNASGIIVSNFSCYLRAYDRRNPVMNIEYFSHREAKNLKMSFQVHYKPQRNEDFKTIFHFENYEVCKVEEQTSIRPLLKLAFEWMSKLVKNYFSICTLRNDWVKFNNITVPNSTFLNLFPVGYFCLVSLYSDDFDPNVFNLTVQYFITK